MKRMLLITQLLIGRRPTMGYYIILDKHYDIVDLTMSRAHALVLRDQHELRLGQRLDYYHVGNEFNVGPTVGDNVIDINTGQPVLQGLLGGAR